MSTRLFLFNPWKSFDEKKLESLATLIENFEKNLREKKLTGVGWDVVVVH